MILRALMQACRRGAWWATHGVRLARRRPLLAVSATALSCLSLAVVPALGSVATSAVAPHAALGSTTAISAQDAAVNALLARDAGVAGLQTAVRAQLFALNPADDAEIVQTESDPALAGELLVDARTDPALAAQLLMLGTETTQSGSVAATTLPTPQDTPTLGGLTSDSTHCYGGVYTRTTCSILGVTMGWDQAEATGWCTNGSGITLVSWAYPPYAATGYCWESTKDYHGADYAFPFSGSYATVDHAIADAELGIGYRGFCYSDQHLDAALRIWFDGQDDSVGDWGF